MVTIFVNWRLAISKWQEVVILSSLLTRVRDFWFPTANEKKIGKLTRFMALLM